MPSLHLKGYQIPFPMASTWCEQSLDIVSGFYSEKISEKDHIASLDGWVPAEFCMSEQLGADIFSLTPIEKATFYFYFYIIDYLL
jgi:hypothetical protein